MFFSILLLSFREKSERAYTFCCFSHSAYWLPTRKNYATRWPIQLEQRKKEKVWQRYACYRPSSHAQLLVTQELSLLCCVLLLFIWGCLFSRVFWNHLHRRFLFYGEYLVQYDTAFFSFRMVFSHQYIIAFLHELTYGHTHSKSMDPPGKVASPARGQLKRKNEYFPVRVRA